jgi:hypothetical protein
MKKKRLSILKQYFNQNHLKIQLFGFFKVFYFPILSFFKYLFHLKDAKHKKQLMEEADLLKMTTTTSLSQNKNQLKQKNKYLNQQVYRIILFIIYLFVLVNF